MRMWMVDPHTMCRKHLLGEHVEIHMLAGSLLRGRSIAGFLRDKILEPRAMIQRHAALAAEIAKRGYKHASPLPTLLVQLPAGKVDTVVSDTELRRRCPECRRLKILAAKLETVVQ